MKVILGWHILKTKERERERKFYLSIPGQWEESGGGSGRLVWMGGWKKVKKKSFRLKENDVQNVLASAMNLQRKKDKKLKVIIRMR